MLEYLLLSKTFVVKTDYTILVRKFKQEIDRSFFKGYIEKDEALLYYRSDFLALPGFAKSPLSQLKLKRVGHNQVQIKFELIRVSYFLFLTIFCISGLVFALTVNGMASFFSNTVLFIFISLFFYSFLLVIYKTELDRFRKFLPPEDLP